VTDTDVASAVDTYLGDVRERVIGTLLHDLPALAPNGLDDLVSSYPSRPGKVLRPALCLAACRVLGGDLDRALNSAVAMELFHNAFLIHDDIQDESEQRRGAPTLHAEFGVATAINIGNATNLVGLRRLMDNRPLLGSNLTWRIFQETELMMRHSIEGQAIELGWIINNACDLDVDDYYRMCLKKTSWYTCIYPCRIGALVAREDSDVSRFDHYGWYLGAAFQIQDDMLNIVGEYDAYGKEICGDLWEGKRTVMIIHLIRTLTGIDRARLERFLGRQRRERDETDVAWVRDRLVETGCLEFARRYAEQLAAAAQREAVEAFGAAPPSRHRDFLLGLPTYVIERDR
jgi:geranylgeranyl diphosphate synthase, type II